MPPPPGPETDAFVDASVQAHSQNTVKRRFPASLLPRLSEAGMREPGEVNLAVRFSIVDGKVAMDGRVQGSVTMTCQRCMQPVKVDVDDEFQLTIADDDEVVEPEDASFGYEPIAGDAARFDLRWLAEEQTLLSVPLVAKHTDEACNGDVDAKPVETRAGQKPFANLKDMLRGK